MESEIEQLCWLYADMSMTWSFPAIISILYGIEQTAEKDEDGE